MPKKKEKRALGRGIDALLESGRQSDVDPDPASESLSEGKVAVAGACAVVRALRPRR